MPNTSDRLKATITHRYAVERELGSGGMATVYLARDLKHGRQVAIKVLRPELAATLGPERFIREIKILAKLTHPHILPLFDSGEADQFLYYVMPYVEGESLRQRLENEGKLSVLGHGDVAVLARTSVLQYQGTQKPVRDIARELGVEVVIESSLFRSNDSVGIQARLIDGATEEGIWSGSYDGDVRELHAGPGASAAFHPTGLR